MNDYDYIDGRLSEEEEEEYEQDIKDFWRKEVE